jgi:hypothetical protein
MSLADELAADQTPKSGVRCSVCVWYEKQTDEDRATFNQWIDDGKPLMRLWRACKQSGLTTGNFQFGRHVNEHHVAS